MIPNTTISILLYLIHNAAYFLNILKVKSFCLLENEYAEYVDLFWLMAFSDAFNIHLDICFWNKNPNWQQVIAY